MRTVCATYELMMERISHALTLPFHSFTCYFPSARTIITLRLHVLMRLPCLSPFLLVPGFVGVKYLHILSPRQFEE
jgi:hypothetical protein